MSMETTIQEAEDITDVVTACVIPILVLLFMIWFVQMLFGIKVNVPKDMPKKISARIPGHKKTPGKPAEKSGEAE